MLFKDLTGMSFNRWTVISKAPKTGKSIKWNCVCDCGVERAVLAYGLTSGESKSCGCLQAEVVQAMALKHGHTVGRKATSEYTIWGGMINRCTNPSNIGYETYGGKGITVCQRWRDSFENFLEDMGTRPSKQHSIDRIDVNGNYEPSNCRWATVKEQSMNKGVPRNNTSGHKGVYRHKSGWVSSIRVDYKDIYLGSYKDIDDAIHARKEAERKYWKNSIQEL